jgi:hypothetical protein
MVSGSKKQQQETKSGEKNQIGDHALPQRGFGRSTPSWAEGKGATRDTGGSARADRERGMGPEANTHEPADTTLSATETPTKRTKAAITEHTASRREREQPCRKEKGSRSQGMQWARTESASKEST